MAVVPANARKGVLTQTWRYSYLVRLIGCNQARFEEIKQCRRTQLPFRMQAHWINRTHQDVRE